MNGLFTRNSLPLALAFLLLVTGFCLLGDSHNHGYLLLRLPDEERSALVLLRAHLGCLPYRLNRF